MNWNGTLETNFLYMGIESFIFYTCEWRSRTLARTQGFSPLRFTKHSHHPLQTLGPGTTDLASRLTYQLMEMPERSTQHCSWWYTSNNPVVLFVYFSVCYFLHASSSNMWSSLNCLGAAIDSSHHLIPKRKTWRNNWERRDVTMIVDVETRSVAEHPDRAPSSY